MTRSTTRPFAWVFAGLVATVLASGPTWAEAIAPADRDRQPKSETEGQARDNLSDRLDRTDGVIRPPSGVDPQMQVPPPEPGARMPVIRPPGTPGGDQRVAPK